MLFPAIMCHLTDPTAAENVSNASHEKICRLPPSSTAAAGLQQGTRLTNTDTKYIPDTRYMPYDMTRRGEHIDYISMHMDMDAKTL